MTDRNPPSSLRIPVTVVLGLFVPPLGLLAWIALSGSRRSDYMRSTWVRAGFAVGIASVAPLLLLYAATVLGLSSDPNPNPIGLGLLLMAGGGLALILVAAGIAVVERDAR